MFDVKIVDIKGELSGLLALTALLGMSLGYKLAKWAIQGVVEFGWPDVVFLGLLAMLVVRGRALFQRIGMNDVS